MQFRGVSADSPRRRKMIRTILSLGVFAMVGLFALGFVF
jgi:hypothetical protein